MLNILISIVTDTFLGKIPCMDGMDVLGLDSYSVYSSSSSSVDDIGCTEAALFVYEKRKARRQARMEANRSRLATARAAYKYEASQLRMIQDISQCSALARLTCLPPQSEKVISKSRQSACSSATNRISNVSPEYFLEDPVREPAFVSSIRFQKYPVVDKDDCSTTLTMDRSQKSARSRAHGMKSSRRENKVVANKGRGKRRWFGRKQRRNE